MYKLKEFIKQTIFLLIVLLVLAALLGKYSKIKFLNDFFNKQKPIQFGDELVEEVPDREEALLEAYEAETRARLHFAQAKKFYDEELYRSAKRELDILLEKYKAPDEKEVVYLMAKVEKEIQKLDLKIQLKRDAEKAKRKVRLRQMLRQMDIRHDNETGVTWYRHLDSPEFANENGIFLYFSKKDGSDYAGSLRLKIQYSAKRKMNIIKYRFDFDGKNFAYTPDNKVKRADDNYGMQSEWSDNRLEGSIAKVIDAISMSSDATIHFIGESRREKRTITEKEKSAMSHVFEVYAALNGTIEYE